MVVSGCPERNGDNHAKEIGLMALDLLHSVQVTDMPSIGGDAVRLRIGIHSGM
jgi:class 3 adenylate cyclase